MSKKLARWVWVLIPVAITVGVVLVVNSENPGSAALDLVWVAGVVGLLLYISISSRPKRPQRADAPDADQPDDRDQA